MPSGREVLIQTVMKTFGLEQTLTEGLLWSIETVQGFDRRFAVIEQRLDNIERGLSLLLAAQQATREQANGRSLNDESSGPDQSH